MAKPEFKKKQEQIEYTYGGPHWPRGYAAPPGTLDDKEALRDDRAACLNCAHYVSKMEKGQKIRRCGLAPYANSVLGSDISGGSPACAKWESMQKGPEHGK